MIVVLFSIFSLDYFLAQLIAMERLFTGLTGDVKAIAGGTLEAYQYSSGAAAVNDAQGWQRLRYTEAAPNLPFNNTYDAGAYLQYQVSPAASKYLNITSFGISVLGGSTGYARLMVKYAISTTTPKDGDFHDMPTTGGYFLENGKAKTYAATATDPVFLINAGKTANTESKRRLTFSGMNLNVDPGQTFYIRLYPYLADLTAPVNIRYLMVRNTVISGETGKKPFRPN